MIEIVPHLFVGNQLDYEKRIKDNDLWWVLHACKEPYHREALGYNGLGGPREHHEYLFAYRDDGRRLILNMVDAPKPQFFADGMMDEAIAFIGRALEVGADVLVHCNQGGSRAPGLALLYLRRRHADWMDADIDFETAEDMFRGLYPQYQPANGIREYLRQHW